MISFWFRLEHPTAEQRSKASKAPHTAQRKDIHGCLPKREIDTLTPFTVPKGSHQGDANVG